MELTKENYREVARERAKAGFEFMKKERPEFKIDPKTLQIDSKCNCVLGQAYLAEHGKHAFYFNDAFCDLGISFQDTIDMGFDAIMDENGVTPEMLFPALQEAWLDLIANEESNNVVSAS